MDGTPFPVLPVSFSMNGAAPPNSLRWAAANMTTKRGGQFLFSGGGWAQLYIRGTKNTEVWKERSKKKIQSAEEYWAKKCASITLEMSSGAMVWCFFCRKRRSLVSLLQNRRHGLCAHYCMFRQQKNENSSITSRFCKSNTTRNSRGKKRLDTKCPDGPDENSMALGSKLDLTRKNKPTRRKKGFPEKKPKRRMYSWMARWFSTIGQQRQYPAREIFFLPSIHAARCGGCQNQRGGARL